MNSINNFHLIDFKYLFFDIFYKNNQIHLILPTYDHTPFDSNDIILKVDDRRLNVSTEHIQRDFYGPGCIYIYDFVSKNKSINVKVEYQGKPNLYTLTHIKTSTTPTLTLTTLCKDDYRLFAPFYKYYKEQGVSHFYIYYNNQLTQEVKDVFDKEDVTLLEWNHLWMLNSNTHHAQTGQLSHSLFKYGKDACEHMIFCDLDEYLRVPKLTLKELVTINKDHINIFGFRNMWSRTVDGKVADEFPTTFYISEDLHQYPTRAKNIYNVETVTSIFVHYPFGDHDPSKTMHGDTMRIYHFYNWSQPNRINEHINGLLTLSEYEAV